MSWDVAGIYLLTGIYGVLGQNGREQMVSIESLINQAIQLPLII